jgi:DNA uptake protein ComE-like DNA-binding protein
MSLREESSGSAIVCLWTFGMGNATKALQLQIGMYLNPVVGKDICHVTTAYRRTQGPFKSIEDIKKVPKIGDKEFALIQDKICVDC